MASRMDQPAATPADGAREIVTRFIEALEQRQIEALAAMLTDDAVHVTAFSPQGGLEPFERYAGRDAVLAHFADVFAVFSDIKLDRTGLFASDDGATVFFEALGENTMADSGMTYRNQYVFKFMLRDCRVAASTEFFNPVTFAQLMAQSAGG